MRTTVRLDDDLRREAKRHAAATVRIPAAAIEGALRENRDCRRPQGSRRRIELRRVGGLGTQPGVDLDDSSSLSGPDGSDVILPDVQILVGDGAKDVIDADKTCVMSDVVLSGSCAW